MQTFKSDFRALMLTSMIILNILAIFAVVETLQKLYDWTIREAEIRTQSVALAIDLHLSTEVNQINLSLNTVADDIAQHFKDNNDRKEQHIVAMIRRHHSLLPQTEGWSFVDAEGKIAFHGAAEEPNFTLADRDYFQAMKTGRVTGLYISKPLKSRLTGNLVMIFARSVLDEEGRFLGIVIVSQPLSYFDKVLSGFDLGPNGTLTLRHTDMGIIARAPLVGEDQRSTLIGDTNVSKQLQEIVTSGVTDKTYHAVAPLDAVERILSYRKMSNAPIQILAGISKSDFLGGWRETVSIFLFLLGMFLLIVNISAALLYRQWQRQSRDAASIMSSNERLAASLKELQERDSALISAEEAGRLGTYTFDIASGKWLSSLQLDSIIGIGVDYPHTIEGWQRLIHPEDRASLAEYFTEWVLGKKQVFDREYRIVRPSDGQVIWVHGLGKLTFGTSGQPVGMSGTIQDVSARKFSEERLLLAQEVFQSAIEGIIVTDREGTILETNTAFSCITGYPGDEVKGKNLRLLQSNVLDSDFYSKLWEDLNINGYWEGESDNFRKDGTQYVQNSRILAIRDAKAEIVRFAVVLSDVTELKESQRRLEYLAYYDDLTGLPNRALLSDRMRQAIAQCRRQEYYSISVCCLDIDGFKDINERWGRDIGDQFLKGVARRLEGCKRASDTVARLGGDEFVILFCNLSDVHDSQVAISRLLQTVGNLDPIEMATPRITFSAGVTFYPHNTTDEPDVLLRQASQAMCEAKRCGKNCVRYFDSESEQLLRDRQAQLNSLSEALKQGQFRLFYQPKVHLYTGRVTGVEALLRWEHPERGLLQPYEFLPVLESSELTLPVGEWIIHEALQQQQKWLSDGIDVQVSVNVFGLHLQRADFVERLGVILRAYPELDPRVLELEVVETTALENLKEIIERIDGCMQMGVQFALDDFGTGYSSLTYMRQLPVNTVKVDRSFVRDMLHNQEDAALVQNIIGMARTLNRKVVAEGLETIEHGVPLIRCGCDYGQGYGIAKPMPPADLAGWVKQWRMPQIWKDALTEGSRMSEERLQLAHKATNAVIWDLDMLNERQTWSGPGKAQFGWPEPDNLPEFLSWWLGQLHPNDRDRVRRSFEDYVNEPLHSHWKEEYQFRKSDGTYAHIIDQRYATRDEHGKPLRIIGAMQDITEHVKLEEKARLQAMALDQIQESVTVTDLDGRILYINVAQTKDLNSSEECFYIQGSSALGKKLENKMTRRQVFEITMREGQWHGEVFRRNSSGNEIVTECRMNIICDAPGKPVAFCETNSDITERIRMYDALHHEAQRRKTLMQKSSDGIAIFDHEHRVIEVNDRFASMLGYSPHEIIGMHSWDFDAVLTKDQILALPIIPMNNNIIETKHRRKDGSIFPVEVSASETSLWDESFIFTISRDITAHKKAESDLVEARYKAESSSRAKSEFLANMSHEIRTPLNGILGMLQLLQTTPLNEEQSKATALAIQASARLTRLLSDILDLSRVESGMIIIVNELFSLRDTLTSVIELFRPAASLQNDVELVLDIDPHLPEFVVGDALRLSQVFTNLLGNALKFTAKGFIKVEAHVLSPIEPGHARLYFSVADTGHGIQADVLRNLFVPFTQGVHGYKRSFQGAGLGLAICKKLIHLMKGTISVETEEGVGTAFHFSISFPLHGAGQIQTCLPQPLAETACGRVLLVEDDHVNCFAVSRLLAKEGYEVSTADNGQEALALYENEIFDFIIMDIQMPVMDGVEVTRVIRAREERDGKRRTPIIALTSYAMKEDLEAFLAAGMDAYMTKPADINELRRVMSETRSVNGFQ